MSTATDPRPFRLPAILLGVGLGGLFGAIVLHEPISGPAFLVTFAVVTIIGAVLLWRARRREPLPSAQFLVGGVLLGAGIGTVVEGLLAHHVLGVHHLRPGPDEVGWDLAFLAVGAILVVAGWWLMRRAPVAIATGGFAPTPRRR